ncbi:MAG: type III secretion HpaP family protein [Puniceicoccales bacterium]|jgi:hypothetical protein|nr:type III secretion HpaP family protein [Puniceicoccales bacterium]
MTDKIKDQSMKKESGGSFDDDVISKKEIAEIKEKADPRDVSFFAEKFTKNKYGQRENDSDRSKTDLRKYGFDGDGPRTNSESQGTKLAENKYGYQGSDFGSSKTDPQKHGFNSKGSGTLPESQGTKLAENKYGYQGSDFGSSKTDPQKHGFNSKGSGTLPESQETKDFIQKGFIIPKQTGNAQASGMLPVNDAKSRKQDLSSKDVDATEVKDTSAISGTKILDNIQLQHIEPKVNEPAQVIKNLAIQVAEKIIATNEALNAKQEVRITLQDGILKDTEVSIFKEGKSLGVVFSTGSSDSENLLRANSDTLMRQLQNNLRDVDRIDIEIEQHERQSASDNQNNDGRSRERFGNQQQGEDEENQDK